MSGSPKYSRVEVEQRRQAELERQRRQQAEAEAQRRREAEARDRQQRLERQRQQTQATAIALGQQIQRDRAQVHAHAADRLTQQLSQLRPDIDRASSPQRLHQLGQQLQDLEQDFREAITQKRRDDAEQQRRDALDRQRFALAELERQQHELSDAAKFDPSGQTDLQSAIAAVAAAIANGQPSAVEGPLHHAEHQWQQHQHRVRDRRAAWQQQQADAQTALGELQALAQGLQADPVVTQWRPDAIAAVVAAIAQGEQAIAQEQFATVSTLLDRAQTQRDEAIATANQAQLQADQRDYIADSIAQSLESLGFVISDRRLEHDHPASAIVLGASTHAGQGISVSIPVEGEVFYDIDGYTKTTETAVDGSIAATCDGAEQVLTEMHHVLTEQFGIQMGELQWEGKDPNRQLHRADDLPKPGQTQIRHA